MSEYLSKKAVLEWLKEKQKKQEEYRDRLEIDHPYWEYHNGASDYLSLAVEEFESGAFDADNTEVQRLRAALEEVHEELKTLHFMIDHDEDIFHERKKKYLSILAGLERLEREYAEERAAHNVHVTELCELEEKNRKLREERDAAVEGYQQQVKYAGELITKLVSAQQERNKLIEVLREIDTHIRSTPEPVQYIVETLKRVLPEYREGM